MFKAILLDLDNTLLQNDMETFVPAYLSALAGFVAAHFPPETFIRHLLRATDAVVAHTDTTRTNMQVFDEAFFPALGRRREELEPLFDEFYATRFPQLRELTGPIPAARPLVERAFAQGWRVAVATNPLFPRTAVEQRLAWAGVPVDEFPYHLVTTYEEMHATKPHRAYYLEIAQRLGCQPEECLMAGDEWEMDIQPAMAVGMSAYWVAAGRTPPAQERLLVGHGDLAGLARWLSTANGPTTAPR